MLEQPEFKNLLGQLLGAIQQSREESATPDVAIDALLFAAAILSEAEQTHKGAAGMAAAQEKLAADAREMLAFVRETSVRHGQSLLYTVSKRPVMN
jgi:hypothetical protein